MDAHVHVHNAVTIVWGKLRNAPLLCNLITEIILMNVQNMTIPAKVCHVKLNKKVSIDMEGM